MAVKAEKAEKAEKAVKAAEPEKVTPKKEAVKKAASFFMYLGPSITGVIQKGTIYSADDVERLTAAAIERFPRIKALIVSDETIVEDRINVTKPGTRLYNEYKKLVAELK